MGDYVQRIIIRAMCDIIENIHTDVISVRTSPLRFSFEDYSFSCNITKCERDITNGNSGEIEVTVISGLFLNLSVGDVFYLVAVPSDKLAMCKILEFDVKNL